MKIALDSLKWMMSIVERVPVHNAILSSQFVQLQAKDDSLTLSLAGVVYAATNGVAQGLGSWEFFVDRRILAAFVGAGVKEVDLNRTSSGLILKSGRHTVSAKEVTTVTGHVTKMKRSTKSTVVTLGKDRRAAIAIAATYAPDMAAADHLACVYFQKGFGVVSTDMRVAVHYSDMKLEETLHLPLLLCRNLSDATALSVDGKGAMAEYNSKEVSGWLYQPTDAKCATDFPIAALQNQFSMAKKTTPAITAKASLLEEVLLGLKAFVFPIDDTTLVCCKATAGKKMASLSIDSAQGPVQAKLTLTEPAAADVELNWAISRLLPWLGYADKETVIGAAFENHVNVFKSGNRNTLLQAEIGK